MPGAAYRHVEPVPAPARPRPTARALAARAASCVARWAMGGLVGAAFAWGALAFALGTCSVAPALEQRAWPRVEARVDGVESTAYRRGKYGRYTVVATVTPLDAPHASAAPTKVTVLADAESLRVDAMKARLARDARVTLLRAPDGRLVAPIAPAGGPMVLLAAAAGALGLALALWFTSVAGARVDFALRVATRRPGEPLEGVGAGRAGVLRDDARGLVLGEAGWGFARCAGAALGLAAAVFAGLGMIAVLVALALALFDVPFTEWSMTASFRAATGLCAAAAGAWIARASRAGRPAVELDLERGVLVGFTGAARVEQARLEDVEAVELELDARGPARVIVAWPSGRWCVFDRDARAASPKVVEAVATRVAEITGRDAARSTPSA